MSKIIALFGMQGAGKSQAAESLRLHRGFHRVSFADPLYEMLSIVLGKSVAETRSLCKNSPLPELGNSTVRIALQTLGTEWGRNLIHKRLWVEIGLRRLKALQEAGLDAVIDDCRFLNEYNALRNINAKFVKIERKDAPAQTSHDSEREWWQFQSNIIVQNDADDAADWLASASDRVLTALDTSTQEFGSAGAA